MTLRGPYRRPSTPFKLQLCQDMRTGVLGRRDAQRSHHLSANLIQLWLTQFDRGELNDEEAEASVIAEYEARIAALERKVGQCRRCCHVTLSSLCFAVPKNGPPSTVRDGEERRDQPAR